MHHFPSSCRLSAPLSHTSSPGGLRHAANAAKQLPYALQQQVNACPAAAAASSCTQCLQLPTWGLLHARPLTHEDFQVPSNVPCALVTPDKELARSGVQSRRPCTGDTFLESCFGTLWVHIHSHTPRICSPVTHLGSSGCTATAVSPSMVSGRVVATTISPSPPSRGYAKEVRTPTSTGSVYPGTLIRSRPLTSW